jgi:serine/threonine protein kinase
MSSAAASAVFSFQSSANADYLYHFTESRLSQFQQEVVNLVSESFITFVEELQEASLPICDSTDFETLNNGQPIGHGTTMTVFKSYWKSRKKVVAVKKINLGVPIGTSMLEIHNQDYKILMRSLVLELKVMTHPTFRAHMNFVDVLGISWEPADPNNSISSYRPAMIVELADESSPTLESWLRQQDQRWNGERQALTLTLLTDIAEGVTMLHTTKIVHGDLKPENVLLFPTAKRLVAKISDFGFCSPSVESRSRIGGTYYWNAPVS